MGGLGSGRAGWRMKAEHCRSIDINRLRREGCLRPGYRGGWQWSRDGEVVASIGLRAESNHLRLVYTSQRYGEEPEHIDEAVPIIYAPCRFGGERPYFACPGVVNGRHCGRRVTKLYGPDRYFLCRHCYRLTYASRSEPPFDRALRRANKRRMRLGGEPGAASPIFRPKGMWQSTYERELNAILDDEERADRLFMTHFGHLLDGVDPSWLPR